MKTAVFLSFISLAALACDPPHILIVENHTTSRIDFEVSTREKIKFDSLHYSDRLIADELIKLHTIPEYFKQRQKIQLIDSLTYLFSLYPNQEALVFPSSIGMPFRTVKYTLEGKSHEIIPGTSIEEDGNFEINHKPLRTTIVKIGK